jgi:dolichyl-phosphate-mannose-protein mannosyltransferase
MAAVWIACVAYLAARVNRDWTPHDEGLLAQSAERLLAGQLPHRDFRDAYTGLLTAYHALAFAIGGHSLLTLRIALLLAFALWIPAYYAIAKRFLGSPGAAITTAAAVAWSVPNYSASMPSWYNLFLATAATLAVLRYLDEPTRRRWLVIAGCYAGASVLVKIVGVYVIGGIGLFLYWRRLAASRDQPGAAPASVMRGWIGPVTAFVVAALVSAGVVGLVHRTMTSGVVLHFIFPGVAVAIIVALAGLRSRHVRWTELLLDLATFAAGIALPACLFLIPFVAGHAVGALISGVFVAPLRRLVSATLPPPSFAEAARALPIIAGVWAATRLGESVRRYAILVAIPLGAVVLALSYHGTLYVDIVDAARALIPITAGVALALAIPTWHTPASASRQRAVLLVFVAVFFSLIQFPFAAVVYFCYIVPLAFLAIIAITAELNPRIPAAVGGPLLVFGLCFAVWRMNTREYVALGVAVPDPKPAALLPPPRGGLRVSSEDSAIYTELVAAVRAHATNDYMYCTPDCPEAYFLAGLKNPTPTTFEFLDDSTGARDRTLRAIRDHRVGVVVLNGQFRFSAPDSALEDALGDQYPDSACAGYFTVLWR